MIGTTVNFSVREDNAGSLVLERTFSPQITPRSKYYATKNIWFHEDIPKCGINILRFDTVERLEGFFTKGLLRTTFEYLRKKIMGWYISHINRINPR